MARRAKSTTDVKAPAVPRAAKAAQRELAPAEPLFLIKAEDPQSITGLVSLNISSIENSSTGKVRIRGVLTCGSYNFRGSDSTYVVRLHNCFLDLSATSAKKDPFHNCVAYFQKAELDASSTEQTTQQMETGAKGEASVAVSVAGTGARFGFGGMFGKKKTRKLEQKLKSKPNIFCVQHTPEGLRIGDELYGHPGMPFDALCGQYLNDRPGEPLAIFDLDNACNEAGIHAGVRVRYGQLRVSREGHPDKPIHDSAYRDDIERCMREAVLGLRIHKEITASASPGDFVLASHTLRITRAKPDDGA